MNREAEFTAMSLPDRLRSITNEALWDYESDAIESAADLIESLRAESAELMDLCTRYANQATNAETERDEALQKIKAAPHQFPQCFRFLCNEDDLTYPCTCWKQMP
jgi:hypothetical protein